VSTSATGSRSAPGGASTTAPPDTSGAKNSQPAASKLSEVFWMTRSVGESPWVLTVHRTRFRIPSWVITTPLGRPVEPEV